MIYAPGNLENVVIIACLRHKFTNCIYLSSSYCFRLQMKNVIIWSFQDKLPLILNTLISLFLLFEIVSHRISLCWMQLLVLWNASFKFPRYFSPNNMHVWYGITPLMFIHFCMYVVNRSICSFHILCSCSYLNCELPSAHNTTKSFVNFWLLTAFKSNTYFKIQHWGLSLTLMINFSQKS